MDGVRLFTKFGFKRPADDDFLYSPDTSSNCNTQVDQTSFLINPESVTSENETVLDEIMRNINRNTVKKAKENILIEEEIEDIIFCGWKQLDISEEKILTIFDIVNDVLQMVSSTTTIKKPRRGQDFIRRILNSNTLMPTFFNIFYCSSCQNIVDYNQSCNIKLDSRRVCTLHNNDNNPQHLKILPIIPRLRSLLCNQQIIQDVHLYTKNQIQQIVEKEELQDKNIPSYMYGNNFSKYVKETIENGDLFFFFTITADGISVFNAPLRQDNKTSKPLLVNLLNYKDSRQHDRREFWVYSISSSVELNVSLQILVKEFDLLKEGIPMMININGNIEERRIVGVLLEVYGDTAEIQELGHFSGPASNFPCRFCNLRINRENDNFHAGIKTSYVQVKSFVAPEIPSNHVEVFYPLSSKHKTCILPVTINGINCIKYTKFLKGEIQQDSVTNIYLIDNTKDLIKEIRNSPSDISSINGIKTIESIFESLKYFDAATSFNLDPMHLFNNNVVLLISLLLGYNREKYIQVLNNHKYKNPNKILNAFQLSLENITILRNRIQNINSFFYNTEGQFRLIFEETSDFNQQDSLLIPLLDLQADIINMSTMKNYRITSEVLEILQVKSNIFMFMCDTILPKEFINSQLHSTIHLSKCIQNSGGLQYCSTWRSERYYSKIKRNTLGRLSFNKSAINKMAQKEVLDLNNVSLKSLKQNSVNTNILSEQPQLHHINNASNDTGIDILDETSFNYLTVPKYEEFKEIHYYQESTHNVFSIKGIRSYDDDSNRIDFTVSFLKYIIKMNNDNINRILFYNIHPNVDTVESMLRHLNCESSLKIVMENSKNLNVYTYSEILVNKTLSYTVTFEDEGVEQLDNSYLMYYENNNNIISAHLVKALMYIQIEDLFLAKIHEYPESEVLKNGLFYKIPNSNISLYNNVYQYDKTYKDIRNFVPSNIIVCDIHNNKINTRIDDEDYIDNENLQKNSTITKATINSNEISTTTVFIPKFYQYIDSI
ncbi:hypothetical protein WA158_006906 [Blastocystis sp. Blastoise]